MSDEGRGMDCRRFCHDYQLLRCGNGRRFGEAQGEIVEIIDETFKERLDQVLEDGFEFNS